MVAFLSSLSVVLTAIYAFLTYKILHANKKQITAFIRPYVHFEVLLDGGSVEAFLKNSGKTAAYDVKISITPQLQAAVLGNARPACLTSATLPMLLPDREIREYTESLQEFTQRGVGEPVFTGTIKYKDAEGNEYDETFRSDLRVLKEMAYIGRPVISEELKTMNDRLADIRSSIQAFNRP